MTGIDNVLKLVGKNEIHIKKIYRGKPNYWGCLCLGDRRVMNVIFDAMSTGDTQLLTDESLDCIADSVDFAYYRDLLKRESERIAPISSYAKLKIENKKLKEDIYNLVMNADKTSGIETKLRYKTTFDTVNAVMHGGTIEDRVEKFNSYGNL